ncbi:uncharacterized protein FN964_013146 [Alca torda]
MPLAGDTTAGHPATARKAGPDEPGALQIPPGAVEEERGAQQAAGNGPEAVPLARWQSHVARLRRSDSSLRFPPLQSTGQESAKGQPGQEGAVSWGKGDGEETSRRRSRAEKGKTPSPWLETPQPDIRPPRGRQVLTSLEPYRSRQEQWRRNVELNRLRAMAPKQFLCIAKKMEVHDPREKPAAGAAGRGMSARSGQVAPRRPAPRH